MKSASAQHMREALDEAIEAAVAVAGTTVALRPSHRVKFDWPPHPVSYEYHVLASDWTGKAQFEAHGETFDVEVATTSLGVFGRCEELWLEARGDSLDLMLWQMRELAEPLFRRQLLIAKTLGRKGRFTEPFGVLSAVDLLKLLYCSDRDVANDARIQIETNASSVDFFPGLVHILLDRRHPQRRSAQWCVLDLFEDLGSFAKTPEREEIAVQAIRDLIWDAEDDYARTIYKAGVVIGGHLSEKYGAPVLLECLKCPSKFGRRSAIHGLFHVVEWVPEQRNDIVAALRSAAALEQEALLAHFAAGMADDLEHEGYDHLPEPVFPEER